MPHLTAEEFLTRAAELFADNRRPWVTISDRRPLDGTTWIRADPAGDNKPPGHRGPFRGQRREIDPKEWAAALLPSELFDMLPTVEAHQNWILYPLERGRPDARESLQIACEYYGRRAADRAALVAPASPEARAELEAASACAERRYLTVPVAKDSDAPLQPDPPIDMLIFCPECSAQHVDKPEPDRGWNNPPHRSHLCHRCGEIWRVADVPTNGVAALNTVGENDTWPHADEPAPVNPKDAFVAEFERRAAEWRAAYDAESRSGQRNSLLILLALGVYCAALVVLFVSVLK